MDTEMNATEKPSAWETPEFVEIRMDAEIGSYQDDFDGQDFH
jgi:coenzyme PQQ precursor peptide PqqA